MSAHRGRGRIVVLIVWDGLRPDFVTQRDTPNLFRLAREGVRFDKHHSIFPTLTMVNATALATGAPPGVNGLEGNNFYLPPSAATPKGQFVGAEGAKAILNLNGSDQFKGRLIGLDTITQEVAREGGYVGVIGKQGPTSVFDNRVATIADGKDIVGEAHKDYLFASEDLVAQSANQKITIPPDSKTTVA
ncbi:MAG TPA: alkaline phosphatase family protein, partial [Candidatus Binatus sp.]|nr:alkaline phosphatase family protein [Candidatus Binatus sp.]